MKKRNLSVLSGIAILGVSLLAPTVYGKTSPLTSDGGGTVKNPVTITFWDTYAGPVRTPMYKDLIKKFEKEYPNIRVNYVGIPSSDNIEKLDSAIQTNSEPDVAEIHYGWINNMVAQGALVPLDSYFNASPEKNQIVPQYISEVRNAVGDHKLYVLPVTENTHGFFLRTDIFKKNHIPLPKTWNDIFQDANKLTNKAKKQYGLTLYATSGVWLDDEPLLWSYSGITSYFDKNGNSTINNPKNIQFMTKLTNTFKNDVSQGDLTDTGTQMITEFENGSAAMMWESLGAMQTIASSMNKKDLTFIPAPPSPSNGKQVFVFNPSGFGVFKDSKHQKAAWTFVQFLCSAASENEFNETFDQIPTNKNDLNQAWLKENEPIQSVLAAMKKKSFAQIIEPAYLPTYPQIQVNMQPEFQNVLLGKETPTAFMNKWADQLNTAEKQYDSIKNK